MTLYLPRNSALHLEEDSEKPEHVSAFTFALFGFCQDEQNAGECATLLTRGVNSQEFVQAEDNCKARSLRLKNKRLLPPSIIPLSEKTLRKMKEQPREFLAFFKRVGADAITDQAYTLWRITAKEHGGNATPWQWKRSTELKPELEQHDIFQLLLL